MEDLTFWLILILKDGIVYHPLFKSKITHLFIPLFYKFILQRSVLKDVQNNWIHKRLLSWEAPIANIIAVPTYLLWITNLLVVIRTLINILTYLTKRVSFKFDTYLNPRGIGCRGIEFEICQPVTKSYTKRKINDVNRESFPVSYSYWSTIEILNKLLS